MVEERSPEVSVTAPAFNEVEGIAEVVKEWISVLEKAGRDFEIVIADDGSTDGTADRIASLSDSRVRLLRSPVNHGYGYALQHALTEARGRYLITIDSDGQFDLADGLPMLDGLERGEFDLVTGSRRAKQDSWIKVAGDRVLNLIVRRTFGLKLKDTNCALKAMTREAAQSIRIEAVGFPTPTEIVVRADRIGWRIGEVPVEHLPRQSGKSKLRALRSGLEFLGFLIYLRLQLSLARWKVLQDRKEG